ncbi:MAG: Asp-tRNA(Asn)/Glu-tRNA(Gln) amidotransferase subunit GatC [Calditrichaeota bacterium]|nr:Asp-tRNA(Asn)/Glu-tRNA(Gln) amidotransferase subunit GatC [Calditrichota bacterium]
MAITRQDIDRLSKLARLEFSEQEKAALIQQLNRILGYMEKIDELDLLPRTELDCESGEATPLREDRATAGLSAKETLLNASKRHGDFFIVPRVVRKSP